MTFFKVQSNRHPYFRINGQRHGDGTCSHQLCNADPCQEAAGPFSRLVWSRFHLLDDSLGKPKSGPGDVGNGPGPVKLVSSGKSHHEPMDGA